MHPQRPRKRHPEFARAPTIGVVIPARDAAATIDRTLRSVSGQSVPADRVVVVDDRSTDATAVLASAWDVAVVENGRAGVSAARNLGITLCDTAYVAFLDADDVWPVEYLACARARLEQTPDIDVLISGRFEVTPEGSFVRWRPPPSPVAPEDVLVGAVVPTSGVIMRTAVARDLGGFDESLEFSQDTDLWARAVAAGHTIRVNPTAVYYTIRDRRESLEKLRRVECARRQLLEKIDRLELVPAERRWWLERTYAVELARRFEASGHRREVVRVARRALPLPGAAVVIVVALLPWRLRRVVRGIVRRTRTAWTSDAPPFRPPEPVPAPAE